jgi:hypothetical protein
MKCPEEAIISALSRPFLGALLNLLMRELILPLAHKQRGFDHSSPNREAGVANATLASSLLAVSK